jgi:hypothetical protein
MNKFFIRWAVVVLYFFVLIVNFLANALPINNMSTGDISDLYPNLFTPAGVTFSIWGLIYLLLFGYVLYQIGVFQKSKDKKREKLFQKISPYFIISSVANIFWIFAWHYTLTGISVVFMFILLFSLIKIADILREEKISNKKDKLFILLPFSIYFGWITVATIANITVFLVSVGWDGFGISKEIWTVIVLLVGALIGVARMFKDKNIPYGVVFIWAYFGIWLKHILASGFNGEYPLVIFTTFACIVFFATAQGLLLFKKAPLFK